MLFGKSLLVLAGLGIGVRGTIPPTAQTYSNGTATTAPPEAVNVSKPSTTTSTTPPISSDTGTCKPSTVTIGGEGCSPITVTVTAPAQPCYECSPQTVTEICYVTITPTPIQ